MHTYIQLLDTHRIHTVYTLCTNAPSVIEYTSCTYPMNTRTTHPIHNSTLNTTTLHAHPTPYHNTPLIHPYNPRMSPHTTHTTHTLHVKIDWTCVRDIYRQRGYGKSMLQAVLAADIPGFLGEMAEKGEVRFILNFSTRM